MVPKEKRSSPIFVHSALDDYGLTPIEFRAFGRVKRRQDDDRNGRPCYESIPNMARGLGVSQKTITRALQVLAAAGLLSERERTGDTTERRITPISNWKPKDELPAIRARIYPQKRKRTPDISAGGTEVSSPDNNALAPPTIQPPEVSPRAAGVPPTPRQDKGYPSEGIPKEGDPTKAIPHTRDDVVAATIVESSNSGDVCVPAVITYEMKKAYAYAHQVGFINFRRHGIKNPEGWLIKAMRTTEFDELIWKWWREKEEREAHEARERAQHEAEQAVFAESARELEAKRAEEEERNRQREIEEAPAREAARQEAEAKREAEAVRVKAEAEEFKKRIREQAEQRNKATAA